MLLAFNADVPAHRFFDTSAATGSAANDLQVIRGYLGVIAFVLIHCFAALCGIWWKLTGPTR